ncbi:polymerase/histidinol phosphatase-like protein [Dipodascopsis uninucleata]
MHSHHSHSGDYILHAKDHLDDIIQHVIDMGFETYCLTEHMPRDSLADRYPEESQLSIMDLESNFDKFYNHARQLQKEYASKVRLLVGFETDYIRPNYRELISRLRSKYEFDMFVGSVHHVKEIPIDFDIPSWELAMSKCGGSPRELYAAYFDEQYDMLTDLKPPVVGHFDLIRLFSIEDSQKPIEQWPEVLEKVERNLDFIISYGGLVELNSAAIRKGWSEPYPRADICKLIMKKDGRFTLSDDSHGIAQVGLNFHKVLAYIQALGIETMYYIDLDDNGSSIVVPEKVADMARNSFWKQYEQL